MGNNNTLIGIILFLMGIISLLIYLLNAVKDEVFSTIELLSFCGIFLVIPAYIYIYKGGEEK